MPPVIQDLTLPNNIVIPAATLEGFMWGGRETGAVWLENVPAIVDSVCQKHNITALQPAPEMRMNMVLFGESPTIGSVVLKLAQPHPEVTNEITCTRIMGETGRYPRLIDADTSAAWSLQERVFPGEMLQTLAQSGEVSDEEATRITATLMRETVRPLPDDIAYTFPDINRWLRSLWEHHRLGKGTIPDEQLELAIRLAHDMVTHPGEQFFLHGDFHHGNILKSRDGWTIIDPKGIVGHRAFEVGPFFYNPIGVDQRDDLDELFTRRLDIFEEILEIDRVTLWRNALVGCVLSDCWSLEDGPINHTHYATNTAALMRLPERDA